MSAGQAAPDALAPLERLADNPIVRPAQIPFCDASGAFNPGAVVCHRTGRVVLLVRVFERSSRRSCLALALSTDGLHVDEILDRPAVAREAPYEEWGVEDARITFLADEGRYAVTYTGYSPRGIRVCLITTDDILEPRRYRRHGPIVPGENKNTVIFPARIGGDYVMLHRPMPRIVLATAPALEGPWPADGPTLLGPLPGGWRSGRVGAGAPPLATPLGWLLPFHGATTIEEGNVYSMGWCLLDAADPARVRWVSTEPALAPSAPYELQREPIPQVDMANFKGGVRVVFPEGMVERGDDLVVYYGAADVSVGAARVRRDDLLASLRAALERGQGVASP